MLWRSTRLSHRSRSLSMWTLSHRGLYAVNVDSLHEECGLPNEERGLPKRRPSKRGPSERELSSQTLFATAE